MKDEELMQPTPLCALMRIRTHRNTCLQNLYKDYDLIEQALTDYQEIKEIAKRYNWDDITSEIFNVKTDKKYRDLFNSAIVSIQEDYRKARALESLKELFDFDFALRFPDNQPMLMITNKRTNEYWEIPIPKEKYDYLKRVLL